ITWRGSFDGLRIIGDEATALHYAAGEGAPETIKLLLDSGVDPFAATHNAISPERVALEVAAICGRADNAEAIIKHRRFADAAVTIRQPILDCCLCNAASSLSDEQRFKLIQVLLEAGANPNASRDGVTPLQIAAREIRPT